MKKLAFLLVIVGCAFVQTAAAQFIPKSDLLDRLELRFDQGFFPQNFEGLIGASTIIVKGRYGRLLSHQKFWGYVDAHDDTRASFQESRNLTDTQTERSGIPLSEYEILIDEVLLGNIDTSTVIFRTFESIPSEGDRLLEKQSVDRLFFLNVNPDGKTFSNIGPAFILSNINGVYAYEYWEDHPDNAIYLGYEFSSTMREKELEQLIKDEIRRQSTL